MLKIERANHYFTISSEIRPVLYCNSGDEVEFETLDCFSNKLIPEGATFGKDNPKQSNPVTGPLFIKGCNEGDTLQVEILEISLGSTGIAVTGPINDTFAEHLSEIKTHRVKVASDKIMLPNGVLVKARPMIGTIGTTPSVEIPSLKLGEHGGNLDCSDITVGTTLLLPVFVDGGLLYMGDLHAVMGDGELAEGGLEIDGRIKVRVTVIKGQRHPLPMVFSESHIGVIGLGGNLDFAVDAATEKLFTYMVESLKVPAEEANYLIGLCAEIKVGQCVNDLKSVVVKLPRLVINKPY